VSTQHRRRPGAHRKRAKRASRPHDRPPYIRCLERRGPLAVWSVDGAYVRKNIDEEFSNFGHHYSVSSIPRHEIWIDQETDADEQRFFIRHAVVERRLMAAGKDYHTARAAANREERRMRVAAGDLRKVIRGKALPDATRVHLQLWKTLPNGVQVWFVKGRLVRSVYDIEFTEGGHEHVYEYVPRGEVWIDDDIHEDERGFVLFHELYERNLMGNGMDYDTAHEEASRREHHYRKHPDLLHEALAAEGWE
jgi:hypothetical protein